MSYKLEVGSVWALRDRFTKSCLYSNFCKVVIKRVDKSELGTLVIEYVGVGGQPDAMNEGDFKCVFYRLRPL